MSLIGKILYCYENVTPFQTAMSLAFIFLFLLYLFLRDMDVPPGPKGSPLLGYWPFLKADTSHVQLQELSKKHGDVMSLRITGQLYIHLGSFKAIKEAHVTKSDYFTDRMYSESVMSFLFGEGVAFINGEPWKIVRKFFLSKFKEYGMNAVKENTAGSIYDSLKEIVDELHEAKGRPIQINDIITMKCMGIFRRIIFNDQGISNEELQELNDLYCEMMTGMTSTNILLSGKLAKYILFPLMPSCWKLKRCSKRVRYILDEVLKRHKSEYDESHVADLVDCYFKERDERRRRGDPSAAYFTDVCLSHSLSQFVTDGVVSVGALIGNFFLTLVEYPDEQDKMYKEISEVIGSERLPTIEDKSKLPYTNAFINETLRFTDFLPIVPSLLCTKETTLQGYKIPAGSMTLLNPYAAHRHPEDFENPEEFNPSRYLPSPGKPRPDLPILFGIGKRACIGEGFSMLQIFLFVTTIVQNFRLAVPEGSKGSSMFWAQERSKICAYPRSHKSH